MTQTNGKPRLDGSLEDYMDERLLYGNHLPDDFPERLARLRELAASPGADSPGPSASTTGRCTSGASTASSRAAPQWTASTSSPACCTEVWRSSWGGNTR